MQKSRLKKNFFARFYPTYTYLTRLDPTFPLLPKNAVHMRYTKEMTNDTSPKAWEQQPDEPPNWYNRFEIYLGLGPSRTPTAAYRIWTGGSNSKLSSTASKRAKEWRWEERAIAYDRANREEKAAFEAARVAEVRQRNRRLNTKIFETISVIFDTADLTNLTKEEARALLPSLRGYLRTASELQRRDLQSTQDDDQLPSSSDWPVIDPTAEKILDDHYDDEE